MLKVKTMTLLRNFLLLMTASLMPISAKWDGFYARGGFSVLGASSSGSFNFTPLFCVAGGYGLVLPNYFTHGLYVGIDIEGVRRSHAGYSHEMLARFGLPKNQYMLYVASKLGYNSTAEHMFWGVRLGVDFDFIFPGFFWGINADWSVPFKDISSTLQTGVTFGYQF